jgi:nitroreductase
MMGVENLLLTAVDMGLATHLKTGAIMADPAARAAVGVPDDQRIVVIVEVGVPAEEPGPRRREPAANFTTWTE